MPAQPAPSQSKVGHFHAVRFYENDDSLCRIVAEFLREGLASKQPAIVAAIPTHRDAIIECLKDQGLDVARVQSSGDLVLLDADETLSAFMKGDIVDGRSFEEVMHNAIERACGNQKDCTVRIYGEMVDVLWKRGQNAAAIKLEMLWNKLAGTHDFSLLCGYSMGHFFKNAAAVGDICGHHTHVVSPDGEAKRVAGAA